MAEAVVVAEVAEVAVAVAAAEVAVEVAVVAVAVVAEVAVAAAEVAEVAVAAVAEVAVAVVAGGAAGRTVEVLAQELEVFPLIPPVDQISPPARPVELKPAWFAWRTGAGRLGGEADPGAGRPAGRVQLVDEVGRVEVGTAVGVAARSRTASSPPRRGRSRPGPA